MDIDLLSSLYQAWSVLKFRYHGLVKLCGNTLDINEVIYNFADVNLVPKQEAFKLIANNWLFNTAPCSQTKLATIINMISSNQDDKTLFLKQLVHVSIDAINNIREVTAKVVSSADDMTTRTNNILSSYYKHNLDIELYKMFGPTEVFDIPSSEHALVIAGLVSPRDNSHLMPCISRLTDVLYPLDYVADDGSRDLKKLFACTYPTYWERAQLLSAISDPICYADILNTITDENAIESMELPSIL